MNERVHDPLEDFLDETQETQTIGIKVVNGIVPAVSVEIESLWIRDTGRTHAGRIDLREPSLLRVVVTIDGVVESRRHTAVIAGETLVRSASRAASGSRLIQGGTKR